MKRSHRNVAVILNQDIDGTGFTGELINAKAGYARNFLLVGGRADIATPGKVEKRQKEIAAAEERRTAEVDKLRETATKIEATPLKLTLKTGPNNRVFGALTAADIAKALKSEQKIEVATTQLHGLPIKRLGDSQVSVKLGLGVTASLTVHVQGVPTGTDESDKPEK